MAAYEYRTLKETYEDFSHPLVVIKVNGKALSENKNHLVINDIEVDLTSGYEASLATFCIYNSFQMIESQFAFEDIKKYLLIGSSVDISIGYHTAAKQVFLGVITKINFIFVQREIPHIQVTAMDVKGIMMSNHYARQVKATTYSEAVKEVLAKTAYSKLLDNQIIKKIDVEDTPDKTQEKQGSEEESAVTIEMVNESDYEFIVKAAKKYNYEFFTDCGIVYFRKAKSNKEIQIELGAANFLRDFDIEYDISGLVEKIEARAMDVGKAKAISASKKYKNKISMGGKAKGLIKDSEKIYIDPTITSQKEAEYRAESLMEEMSYRFGSITCTTMGLPDITPGNFIEIVGLGIPVDNQFYIVSVRHIFDRENGYTTLLKGKAASVKGN